MLFATGWMICALAVAVMSTRKICEDDNDLVSVTFMFGFVLLASVFAWPLLLVSIVAVRLFVIKEEDSNELHY
jgi:hypothetical protein